LTVTVELAFPVARFRWFVIVTSQATARPPPLKVPLHWLTADPGAPDALSLGVPQVNISITARMRPPTTTAPTWCNR
jgi:hypothetical protein